MESLELVPIHDEPLPPRSRNLLERLSESDPGRMARVLECPPAPTARLRDANGQSFEGLNFASRDALSLSSHPSVHEAVRRALRDFGPHGAGSPNELGATSLSSRLEQELGRLLEMDHVLLFPSGWSAGYGTITALVGCFDYVLVDESVTGALAQAARAATGNVLYYSHCDVEEVRAQLCEIRERVSTEGVLVVSEALSPVTSERPDLAGLLEASRRYGANLLVDVSHDLGCLADGGRGELGRRGLLGKVDLVIGSLATTFASNAGFLATRSRSVREHVAGAAASHALSSAASPLQVAAALEALAIATGEEGERRRAGLMLAVGTLRDTLSNLGIRCRGAASPVVPVDLGPGRIARDTWQGALGRGLVGNLIDVPWRGPNELQLSLRAMAHHSCVHAVQAARIVWEARYDARQRLVREPGQ